MSVTPWKLLLNFLDRTSLKISKLVGSPKVLSHPRDIILEVASMKAVGVQIKRTKRWVWGWSTYTAYWGKLGDKPAMEFDIHLCIVLQNMRKIFNSPSPVFKSPWIFMWPAFDHVTHIPGSLCLIFMWFPEHLLATKPTKIPKILPRH